MAYDPIKNYEDTQVSEELHGEVVTLANGASVFIKKASGKVYKLRATFTAHFQTYAEGFHAIGTTFTHRGIEFVVESINYTGNEFLRDNRGQYIDERTYALSCVSVEAFAESQLDQLKAGLTDG